jgi:hypothetical protein
VPPVQIIIPNSATPRGQNGKIGIMQTPAKGEKTLKKQKKIAMSKK